MKLYILPKATVHIYTTKTPEYIINALNSFYKNGKNKKIKYWSANEHFEIWRTLSRTRSSEVITKGTIKVGVEKNLIVLDITTKAPFLPYSASIWYGFNTLILLLVVWADIRDRQFSFYFLIPIVFIFIGYGFSTLTLKSEIDNSVTEIQRTISKPSKVF
jgi:hypothetical protein